MIKLLQKNGVCTMKNRLKQSISTVVIMLSLFLISLSGCITPSNPEIDEPILPARGFFMGILPNPAHGQPFEESYEQAAHYAECVPVWASGTGAEGFWDYAEKLKGSWGKTFLQSYIRGNDMFPIIHFSFIDKDEQGNLILKTPESLPDATLNDDEWRSLYKESILDVVTIACPKYLSIGNEVNRWFEEYGDSEENPNGFQHFISLYNEIYDAVKEVSSETSVFCVFSREIVEENRAADLSVLSYFDEQKMDLLAFTSYPYAVQGITRPVDIPSDYYSSVAAYMPDTPFGFTELGWSSLDDFGGEQAQFDFLMNLTCNLMENDQVNLLFFSYIWLHDQNENDTIGLITSEGREKQGYDAWKQISNASYLWYQQENEQIVFMSRADDEEGELYLLNKKGEITRLTDNKRHENNPALSRDGSKVAFHAGESDNLLSWDIYVVDIHTLQETRLTNNTVLDGHPDWSPDGSKIVYASFQDDEGNPSDVADLYVIDLNGTFVQQLTDNEWEDNDPEWSPDGSMIAFKSTRNSQIHAREELFVMNSDGSNVCQLTHTSGWESDHDPSWNSLSTKITYMHYAGSRPWTDIGYLNTFINHWEELTPWNTYVVDLNATSSQVTNTEYIAQLAVFSKDDERILYLDNEFILFNDQLRGIHHYFTVINPDGSEKQRLLPEDRHTPTVEYFDW